MQLGQISNHLWSKVTEKLIDILKSAINFIKHDIPAIAQIGGGSNFTAMKYFLDWFAYMCQNGPCKMV